MLDLDEYIKLLAGLTSVVDPIGAIPFFISLTEHRSSQERKHSAWVCALAVGIVLLVALTAGEFVLHLFGIGIPSFQIAGGILILLMGITMLQASPDRSRNTPEERAESLDKDSIAVVPMAIPLLSGPGAISTVIVYHNIDHSWAHSVLVGCVIATVSLSVLTALMLAERIAALLGRTGMNVVTRVFGLIISAVAVEFITQGLGSTFPSLGHA